MSFAASYLFLCSVVGRDIRNHVYVYDCTGGLVCGRETCIATDTWRIASTSMRKLMKLLRSVTSLGCQMPCGEEERERDSRMTEWWGVESGEVKESAVL